MDSILGFLHVCPKGALTLAPGVSVNNIGLQVENVSRFSDWKRGLVSWPDLALIFRISGFWSMLGHWYRVWCADNSWVLQLQLWLESAWSASLSQALHALGTCSAQSPDWAADVYAAFLLLNVVISSPTELNEGRVFSLSVRDASPVFTSCTYGIQSKWKCVNHLKD